MYSTPDVRNRWSDGLAPTAADVREQTRPALGHYLRATFYRPSLYTQLDYRFIFLETGDQRLFSSGNIKGNVSTICNRTQQSSDLSLEVDQSTTCDAKNTGRRDRGYSGIIGVFAPHPRPTFTARLPQ